MSQSVDSNDSELVANSNDSSEVVAGSECKVEVVESISETLEIPISSTEVVAQSPEQVDNKEQELINSSGKQYIIVTANGDTPIGIGTLQPDDSTSNACAPGTKRFKIQGEDGHSYFLTVADDSENAWSELNEEPGSNKSLLSGRQESNKRNLLGADVTQAWFTSRDDKNSLHSKGASWKQGQWSKEEVEILQANIMKYCSDSNISDPTEIIFEMSKDERKDFYRTIAQGLQRPLFSVYRRVTRMYDQKNHIGRYTPEEMQRLRELRMKHGNDWAAIGTALGRSSSSVKDKCRLMRDTCNSGKWLPEEEKRLAAAVYDLSGAKPGENVTQGLSWAFVAERVITRSEKQCRTKWLNYLNWKQRSGADWTRDDDINLVLKVSTLPVKNDTEIDWTELAQDWLSVRSPQWLRGKWWSLKRHIPDYQILPFPELLECMKTFHLNSMRLRGSSISSGVQKFELTPDMTYIPVTFANVTDGTSEENEAALQAFEVLQQLPSGSGSGTFLITQPQVNASVSLTGTQMGTDHIIVHTLPVTQSLGETCISTDSDGGMVGQSDVGSTGDISDLVMPAPASPTFVQTSSNDGELMSSLSDPMLNADGNDLIGTSDIEKNHSHSDDQDLHVSIEMTDS
ncbi:hypothetical protein CHS0354_029918 [Potamilus streckersoni]|uniref:Cyclin-D-binding Myb-like transcription factor 1 n=1 Tax=Potamilus streckersoni TaxID=2493646 RepID=A0AAE0VIF2_9BIVA|nr:hypothetical protein CHS0354_029918 [Potamilus streckersoni]